ncbi:MAG TPA: hypothetical protein V6D02_16395, partial [Candidatus Obscuribacterales bacterium]
MMLFQRFFRLLSKTTTLGLIAGLSLTLLWGCFGGGIPAVTSDTEAETVLLESVLPKLDTTEEFVSDEVASRYTTDTISEPLPSLEDFPLYAATPSNNADTVYLEIFSSSEKAN